VDYVSRAVVNAQLVSIPGGVSGGDEPDGSAKFITAFFRNPAITDAIHALLQKRDGLLLGICNGFQALIKLGLVPCGEITLPDRDSPTLTFNTIGRHQARYVYTRVASVQSPWMSGMKVGDVHALPVSHGEGRFVANDDAIAKLLANGQLATQYCDNKGMPSMDTEINPNGSVYAVEGIFSPDGRVFGKMGHSERRGPHVAKNISGDKHQPIFESGIQYFT
jgi:phosphoribosylformylglycinamidine synthase